jgi:hypothetical protein
MTIIRGVVILMLHGWFIPTRPPDENSCQEPTVSINVVAGYSYVIALGAPANRHIIALRPPGLTGEFGWSGGRLDVSTAGGCQQVRDPLEQLSKQFFAVPESKCDDVPRIVGVSGPCICARSATDSWIIV